MTTNSINSLFDFLQASLAKNPFDKCMKKDKFQSALLECVSKTVCKLYYKLDTRVRSKYTIEDMESIVMKRLLYKLNDGKYDSQKAFGGFIYTVANSAIKDELRKANAAKRQEFNFGSNIFTDDNGELADAYDYATSSETDNPEKYYEIEEMRQLTRDFLSSLQPYQYALLTEEKPIKEISKDVNIPLSTLNSQKKNLLGKFKAFMGEAGYVA